MRVGVIFFGACVVVFFGAAVLVPGGGVDAGWELRTVDFPVFARSCRAMAPSARESSWLYVFGGRVGVGGTSTNDCTSDAGRE